MKASGSKAAIKRTAACDRFNADHPVGTSVLAYTATLKDAGKAASTSGPAFVLGGHTPVVCVEGLGVVALTHVRVMTKTQRLDASIPDWRTKTYPGGARMFAADGTMLDEHGNRSIFDDVDE